MVPAFVVELGSSDLSYQFAEANSEYELPPVDRCGRKVGFREMRRLARKQGGVYPRGSLLRLPARQGNSSDQPLPLFDEHALIGRDICQPIAGAAGPANFDLFNFPGLANTEVQA